jgi:two-component system, cell cycle sensor histidine kinase and response regulator CckA
MQHHLSTREAARVELVRNAICDPEGITRAFLSAARLSARTLKVARVGIWCFQEDGAAIRCRYLYDSSKDHALDNEVLDLESCPAYASALRSHRIIAADDAQHDARTQELAAYLTRHGITSLLDSPIFEQGVAVGIVCHEHVGPRRSWSKEESNFAATVSDMLGLYLEQDAAQRHYRSLLDMRSELQQARVMESVGRLAAGVAHDFNNVLNALGMCSELLRMRDAPSREFISATVDETQNLVEQGARLVRQLLDVARQKPCTEVTDVVDVVRNLTTFMHTLEPDGVRFEFRPLVASAGVRVERSRIEQVVMNLAVNARDAMLGGGTLTVEVSRSEPSDEQPARVVLRVVDTGAGMDEHTRERIFEPYFTTKSQSHRGIGLGLATVYRIAQDAGGSIHVKSAPGEGTEFRVELPAA